MTSCPKGKEGESPREPNLTVEMCGMRVNVRVGVKGGREHKGLRPVPGTGLVGSFYQQSCGSLPASFVTMFDPGEEVPHKDFRTRPSRPSSGKEVEFHSLNG